MATDEFAIAFTVGAPAKTVYARLIDPRNYIGLCPSVVEVRDIRPSHDDQHHETVSYLAIERFRAGFLRWDNKIRVTLVAARVGRRLVRETRRPARVRLTATVDLADLAEGTSITETIRVTAPAIFRNLVRGRAESVQRARAAELTRRMAD